VKPRALDLFCGAGGATRGLQMAGFHVTGVDIAPQPRYCGDAFFQGDALQFPLQGFDFIWASPPCQAYSPASWTRRVRQGWVFPDLVAAVRIKLAGRCFVIENVPAAPLRAPAITLCGLTFDLPLIRHRVFESSVHLLAPSHIRHRRGAGIRGEIFTVCGRSRSAINRHKKSTPYHTASVPEAKRAMGIDWMTYHEMAEAVPPAYAEYIGAQIFRVFAGGPAEARNPAGETA
jgi:DNA (cytosine-5)-methyltransferase 1